jgi:hypothetical protein
VAYSFLGYDPPKREGSRVYVQHEHGDQNRAKSSSGRTCRLASAPKASSSRTDQIWSTLVEIVLRATPHRTSMTGSFAYVMPSRSETLVLAHIAVVL